MNSGAGGAERKSGSFALRDVGAAPEGVVLMTTLGYGPLRGADKAQHRSFVGDPAIFPRPWVQDSGILRLGSCGRFWIV